MQSWQVAAVLGLVSVSSLIGASRAGGIEPRELGRVTARAAVVMDAQTGAMHFARNPTLPLPPASTTKLLTALIALRTLSPDTALPVSSYASSMQPTKVWLKPGWQISARDALYAVLLRSANDASVVIAEGTGGSVANFARMMNATAESVGATGSNFVTPNGLPAPNHYSTARDMALILRAALQTPGMRDILLTRTASIRPLGVGRKPIALRSTNRLLWRDDLNVVGKTGWTREAKRCFVGAASANGHEVIVAVLGSSDLWGDVEMLVRYGLDAVQGDPWHHDTGWQLAAVKPGLLGTAWSRGVTDEIADAAPPPGAIDRRRGMRMAAVEPPTRRAATKGRAAPVARGQGDRVDPRASTLRYAVEVGSFQSKARAQQLRDQLAKRGFRAQVEAVGGRHRVRLTGFASRDAAQKTARTLSRSMRLDPVVIASK